MPLAVQSPRMLARRLRVGQLHTSRIIPGVSRRHVTSSASLASLASLASRTIAVTLPRDEASRPDVLHAGSPLPPTETTPTRQQRIKDAKPFSDFLTDTYSRQHDYLRISVTERCNLRCLYCMPEEGVPLSFSRSLLTTPEIVLLSSLFVSQGVTKIRLTGGEPTVRKDIVPLMQQIGSLRPHGLRELCLTTNGLSLHRKLEPMVEAGLTGVNLSLDTLDPWQFQIMTRRNGFAAVQKSIERIYELNKAGAGIKFKINCVVMREMNDREIIPFVEMTRDNDVEVRFIEYMPFDGNKWSKGKMMGYQEMLDVIGTRYPVEKVQDLKSDTSKTYQVPGFKGRIGFITSMTHNFCGTCNRLRITGDGNLKVCLFGNEEVSLRDIVRKINNGEPIEAEVFEAMKQIAMDESRHLAVSDRPLVLGPNSQELLDVIRLAVKAKKEQHAGLGDLEHMKNRPMILIGSAHMVSISSKSPTSRLATAKCSITFTTPLAITLIGQNQMKKGDVLGVARIAGIMASKRTPDLIPLCHPIPISHVSVEIEVVGETEVEVAATVSCDGKTGVEMEALTAAGVAALTVYDMCKAVDKGMVIGGLRVVLKEGGKSGRWVEGQSQ